MSKPLASNSGSRAKRSFLIPDQVGCYHGRKTLVIDLDETLVHSSLDECANPDVKITVRFEY